MAKRIIENTSIRRSKVGRHRSRWMNGVLEDNKRQQFNDYKDQEGLGENLEGGLDLT